MFFFGNRLIILLMNLNQAFYLHFDLNVFSSKEIYFQKKKHYALRKSAALLIQITFFSLSPEDL